MRHETTYIDDLPRGASDAVERQWHEAGAALGRSHSDTKRRSRRAGTAPNRRRRVQKLINRVAADPQLENAAWVLDNFRLIFGAEKEARTFSQGLREFPVVPSVSGAETPRVLLLARSYLEASRHSFCEPELTAFLQGYQ